MVPVPVFVSSTVCRKHRGHSSTLYKSRVTHDAMPGSPLRAHIRCYDEVTRTAMRGATRQRSRISRHMSSTNRRLCAPIRRCQTDQHICTKCVPDAGKTCVSFVEKKTLRGWRGMFGVRYIYSILTSVHPRGSCKIMTKHRTPHASELVPATASQSCPLFCCCRARWTVTVGNQTLWTITWLYIMKLRPNTRLALS